MSARRKSELFWAQVIVGAILCVAGICSTAFAAGPGTCHSTVNLYETPNNTVSFIAVDCDSDGCSGTCPVSVPGDGEGEVCAGCRCSNAQSSTICEAYSCLTPIEGQPGEFTSVEDCYNWTECPAGKVCILDWDRHEDEPLPGWDTYVYWCVCQ